MTRPNFPRLALLAAAALCAVGAAVPLVAFVIIPQLVRSTVHEAPPAPVAVAAPVSAGSTNPPAAAVPTPVALASGMLRRVDAVHYGSGQVTIFALAGTRYLRFENVSIAGAPNMFVYLSDRDDGRPGTFADLGPLKATDGSFNYPLPDGLALGGIHSVVVWCRAFSVTVTYADLG